MKQLIKHICLLAFVCTCQKIQAQKSEVISLEPQHIIITSSAFSNVRIVDTRLDTTLGIIHRGALQSPVELKNTQPLKDELASAVAKLILGASKQEGTLCVNIRQFGLSEYSAAGIRTGVFRLSAVFYLRQANSYRKLLTVNTRVLIKAVLGDVTKRLLDTVPQVWGSLVQQAASYDPAQSEAATQLTARYIDELDVEEKKALPVYNTNLAQKGLYATFDDFKNNRPSQQAAFYYKDGVIAPLVYELKENGMVGKEIKFNKFYAVCDGKKMYVSGLYGLYPLTKTDNDFYFECIGMEGGSRAIVDLGDKTIIIPRSVLPPYDYIDVVHKIDHITGEFIPVRRGRV
ncbi:hypothetical protein A4H97_14810 [Niastella yeongjuensis]|uniref:Uncharacterized protein n=1 Tax=Niastella yeongjuensis TaxID=354355 RepID=A0A1V9E417_9BACT|nr:hypothetical protein [Niastella yeongjuensis]OQP40877.1 hypothetical protein A4H97_14810 [Niastella yeongjuensis]SEO99162.1 hypothetical protein SAMN05660816_04089 [Niastella yeongjuensis]